MDIIVKRFEQLTTSELYEILKLRVDVFVHETVYEKAIKTLEEAGYTIVS
jgi:predicted GNAT family N-acyltransferase